jgi:hypothetical protein
MLSLSLALQLTASAVAGGPGEADSLRTLREARRAQQRFEMVRRSNLPFSNTSASRPCEARIGRFCYWEDDDRSHPAERPAVTSERESLLAFLTEAAASRPHDGWIAGQAVRYLIDANRLDDARRIAGACRGERWWCASLAGLAAHVDGDFTTSNAAFDDVLAAMPPDAACRWRDISPLLEEPHRRSYARLSCVQRRDREDRFWLLSKPLYVLPANDLRSEHFARRVMSRLEEDARGAYDVTWGEDVDELLVRYGWPTSWSRVRESQLGAPGFARIVGHEPVPNWQFAVSGRALDAPLVDVRPDDWRLRPPAATSRYAARYARTFRDLDHQLARFRKGDSTTLVAAVDVGDAAVAGSADAVLAVASFMSPAAEPLIAVAPVRGGRGVVRSTVAGSPQLVGVELFAIDTKAARRARYGLGALPAGGRIATSDILIHAPAELPPKTLDAASPLALGTTQLDAAVHSLVGVYWESYGLAAGGETAEVVLALERTDISWLQRAASRVRRGSSARPLHIRWQEVYGLHSDEPGRSLTLELSGITPGRYLLSVTVAGRDRSTSTSELLIRVSR